MSEAPGTQAAGALRGKLGWLRSGWRPDNWSFPDISRMRSKCFQSVAAPMHQRLKKQPWGTADFIVQDPDGNLIHLARHVGPPDV